MKLRNKKTDEIKEFMYVGGIKPGWCDELTTYQTYKTLAELNEEWEDYKPTKPLIKDEKIRKLVREWANMNNLIQFEVYVRTVELEFIGWADGCDIGQTMSFSYSEADFDTSDIERFKRYTIAELCGEEE